VAEIVFFLNGNQVKVTNPAPELLLIDYLRSPQVGLAGPKKPCGQGGCGGCTVILSGWKDGQPYHRAINACLRPVCSLNGFAVTTVEGTSAPQQPRVSKSVLHSLVSTRGGNRTGVFPPAIIAAADAISSTSYSTEGSIPINEAAWALATNNGSQCGYCSVGFVMNMSEYLINGRPRTSQDIEDAFDGNLCRCTGYRPIMTGMKTLASPPAPGAMKCELDPVMKEYRPTAPLVQFPSQVPKVRRPADGITIAGQHWRAATTTGALQTIFLEAGDSTKVRLIQANTSFGIYPREYQDAEYLVDISLMTGDIAAAPTARGGVVTAGAATTYTDFIDFMNQTAKSADGLKSTLLDAVYYMARRTAGRIVRNAGTLGGNIMLMLQHINKGSGEPFPSDLCTALAGVGATIRYTEFATATFDASTGSASLLALADRCKNTDLASRILITVIEIPAPDANQIVLTQKAAQREVNSHAIVNCATSFTFAGTISNQVTTATVVLGGIAPYPLRIGAVESAIAGQALSLDAAPELCAKIADAVAAELKAQASRYAGLPSEGVTDDYRIQLSRGFLYKAIVNALRGRAPIEKKVESAGEIKWGTWGVSTGKQSYDSPDPGHRPVAQPYIRSTALDQAAGRTHYTHELPVPAGCLNAAFVQSRRAVAKFSYYHPAARTVVQAAALKAHLTRKFPGDFAELITVADVKAVPNRLNDQGMGFDQPMFADGEVRYFGQVIAMVLARTEQLAVKIADYVSARCLRYSDIGWPPPYDKPIVGVLDAISKKSIFPDAPATAPWVTHAWRISRPGSDLGWVNPGRPDTSTAIEDGVSVPVGSATCQRIESSQLVGGQAHFYMETQACLAIPEDHDSLTVYASTQSPMEMHQTIAMITGIPYNRITLRVAAVGGGFGGKTEQARFITGPAALAAYLTKRPVRLALPRDADTAMIGKRHGYFGQVQLAVDGSGTLHGFDVKMWGDGGAYYDCSYIVSNCIQTRADNAYYVPNFQTQIDVCRTSTAPSTAMRAFGDLQGMNIVENAIEDAAVSLKMRPDLLREKNFYQRDQETPFGQRLTGCYIRQVWDYLKQQCDFDSKLADVEAFNAANKWRKRGVSIIPVKYGSGYNWLQLEQSQAVVVINPGDGTVTVHQAGVDIGQGLATQVLQVAARALTIPLDMIRVDQPQTNVIPSPTSTGASTGTPYSCEAVNQVCLSVRKRLLTWVDKQRTAGGRGDNWCKEQGIDYWNADKIGRDWNLGTEVTINGVPASRWAYIAKAASADRQSMLAELNVQVKGGDKDMNRITYKPESENQEIPGIAVKSGAITGDVQQFTGFTYSAACSVAEVDILTGETKIISADIMYDIGKSMNPAIDIGQVEGAFIQGVGVLTSETLPFQDTGELNAVNTWRYKIPAHVSIPLELNTYLFPRSEGKLPGGAKNADTGIYSAKEVGEPPLVLANSVFFAIKAAIRASREERGLTPLFRLNAPATPQEVSRACEVDPGQLKTS